MRLYGACLRGGRPAAGGRSCCLVGDKRRCVLGPGRLCPCPGERLLSLEVAADDARDVRSSSPMIPGAPLGTRSRRPTRRRPRAARRDGPGIACCHRMRTRVRSSLPGPLVREVCRWSGPRVRCPRAPCRLPRRTVPPRLDRSASGDPYVSNVSAIVECPITRCTTFGLAPEAIWAEDSTASISAAGDLDARREVVSRLVGVAGPDARLARCRSPSRELPCRGERWA